MYVVNFKKKQHLQQNADQRVATPLLPSVA